MMDARVYLRSRAHSSTARRCQGVLENPGASEFFATEIQSPLAAVTRLRQGVLVGDMGVIEIRIDASDRTTAHDGDQFVAESCRDLRMLLGKLFARPLEG
jgi:hypothetical protein